jgi:hypothetical protein
MVGAVCTVLYCICLNCIEKGSILPPGDCITSESLMFLPAAANRGDESRVLALLDQGAGVDKKDLVSTFILAKFSSPSPERKVCVTLCVSQWF